MLWRKFTNLCLKKKNEEEEDLEPQYDSCFVDHTHISPLNVPDIDSLLLSETGRNLSSRVCRTGRVTTGTRSSLMCKNTEEEEELVSLCSKNQ